MSDQVAPPNIDLDAFTCPHCGAYAQQAWPQLATRVERGFQALDKERAAVSVCRHCQEWAWWVHSQLVYPATSQAPLPHPDMPEGVADDYNEARNIVGMSARGAAALLRLALQKLCVELGEPGKNLNDDIGSLVKKGLLPQVQQSLDILRVVGNNAVHPGEIDLRDDHDTATALFNVMNVIVEQLITAPKHAERLYSSLPKGALDAIEKRDSES